MSDNERNDDFDINDNDNSEMNTPVDKPENEEFSEPVYNTEQARSRLSPLTAVLLCVSALLLCTAVLLVTFISLGRRDGDATTDTESESAWEDLYIDDGDSSDESTAEEKEEDAEALGTQTVNPVIDLEWKSEVDFPDKATINKTQPLRRDENKDGRADIETDASGNVLTSAGANGLDVATVVNNVADSVVEIRTETVTNSSWVGQYVVTGAGSGVVISKEGYIVTNNHVVEGADNIIVRMTNGNEYAAYLVGADADTDIAVIWIDPKGIELSVATLGSSFDLVVGEDVIAIGNPLGSLGGTVTDGIVSATARNITIDGRTMTLLQISAPINPGNSGGGLFNLAGQLVGVVNAKCSSEEVEGLGFAIPIDTAHKIIDELIRHRYVRGKASLGISTVDVTSVQTAMMYFNSRYTGVYVYETGDEAGLKYGDLIISVGGVDVGTTEEISNVIRELKVGDTVTVNAYRSSTNKTFSVKITLTEYIPEYLEPAA